MDFQKSNTSTREFYNRQHRFEHWYKDNQVYFITARCRDKFPAFQTEAAKQIVWRQFDKYAAEFQIEPWIVSLMNNHYHVISYLKVGKNLRPFMQRFHGSVAKLVNDTLDTCLTPFFIDSGHQNYFDGCLRDVKQLTRAYRYTLLQSVRHQICALHTDYPHTRAWVEMSQAVCLATERRALLQGVGYARYNKNRLRREDHAD